MAWEEHKGLEVQAFATKRAWGCWLRQHHRRTQGIWIKLAKKDSGIASISYVEARELAIAFGWIDGLVNGLDEGSYLLRFTPRRPRSKWSQINRGIAEQLIHTLAANPELKIRILRSLVPRTFVDCNRMTNADGNGGMTSQIPAYVTDSADIDTLNAYHQSYTTQAEHAFDEHGSRSQRHSAERKAHQQAAGRDELEKVGANEPAAAEDRHTDGVVELGFRETHVQVDHREVNNKSPAHDLGAHVKRLGNHTPDVAAIAQQAA